MRDYQDIEIVAVALHEIAARAGRFTPTELEIVPPMDDGADEFLIGHVQSGLKDSQAKAALFAVQGADRAEGQAHLAIAQRDAFLPASTRLAEMLYGASEADERVSDGTLAVVLCRAKDGEGATHDFLSLLKLDPSSGFQTAERTVSGRRQITFRRQAGILPSVDERLQKAAFIRPAAAGDEYQVLLVDRQRGGGVVSDFFIRKFLGAELALDSTERTRRLLRQLTSAKNLLQHHLDAEELAELDRYIHGATSGSEIDLDDFVDRLPSPDKTRDTINTALSAALPDRQFDLDEEVTRSKFRRRTYIADNGIKVSVPDEFVDQLDIEDDPENEGGRIISFRTMRWDEQ